MKQMKAHVSDAEEFPKVNSIASETKKRKAHVSEEKKKIVSELADLVKGKKTILLASIRDLPASQYQEISKKLRTKAIVKLPKRNLILRAIDLAKNSEMKKIESKIESSIAVLFSDLDAFELSVELLKNKSPAKARPGQEAPEDIVVKAGATELVPGPAFSELGAVGLKVQVQDGKLHIKEDKVIVKKGEKISEKASDVMSKLNIKPFSIGFIPLAGFDVKENKFYSEIKINREETLMNLKDAFARVLPFAVSIGYVSDDTIKLLLQKAEREAKVLEKFQNSDDKNHTPENKTEGVN